MVLYVNTNERNLISLYNFIFVQIYYIDILTWMIFICSDFHIHESRRLLEDPTIASFGIFKTFEIRKEKEKKEKMIRKSQKASE